VKNFETRQGLQMQQGFQVQYWMSTKNQVRNWVPTEQVWVGEKVYKKAPGFLQQNKCQN
jgi:hypothetical protein